MLYVLYCKKITSIDNLINDKKIAESCLKDANEDNKKKQEYIEQLEEDNRRKQIGREEKYLFRRTVG